ncbi:MAG: Clp protease ClpP [Bacteroidaceae bacterium]|nr:Clp protease ClpP [Bacteroidaceae bacterium]
MAKKNYNLHLKGYVGGWDFDADYVDYVLGKNPDGEVNVLIDSLGGSLSKALSIVAAFRNHGNVNVHFVGMNASAATIASLGAKHVSMDSSAMYLVHKCSMEFFQWASANSDKLRSIIKEAEQMKEDLDKMDANVAQMYAAKCKREPSELLALMKKGGWLTAKEALEWGFVDEITDFEDDMAPVITDDMAADMSSAGIPMPENFSRANSSAFNRFIVALTNFFRSNQNKIEKMNTENSTKANAEEKVLTGSEDTSAVSETVSADVQAKAISDKDAEIKALRDEIEALKKTPGDSTSHIVDESKKGAGSLDPNSPEAFFETKVRAQELYDMLP